MRRSHRLLFAAVLACAGGCGIGQGQLRDQVLNPGPVRYQQQRANHFDPYPELKVGTPDNTIRPRNYLEPIPEPARGRWPQWGLPRFGYW